MEVDRQCAACKQIFTVNGINIKQRLCHTDDTKDITVTFCECEKCGAMNVLQLDDNRTLQDLRRLTTLIGRRVRSRSAMSFGRDTEADRKMADKLERRIKDRRNELWVQNVGKTFYERNGKILIKSLDNFIDI